MTYYAACSKLLLNPRLENMDTNVQKTLSTPQKKVQKVTLVCFYFVVASSYVCNTVFLADSGFRSMPSCFANMSKIAATAENEGMKIT